jgi:hypothetical protein
LKSASLKPAKYLIKSAFLVGTSGAGNSFRGNAMKAPTTATARHMFAIKVLDRLPGLFKPNRYLYHCARCKWSFVVNDGRRGVITPVDDNGKPLAHEEAIERAKTFALGPCPALQVLNFEHGPILASNGATVHRIDGVRRAESRAN